jgi:hypothetical protein
MQEEARTGQQTDGLGQGERIWRALLRQYLDQELISTS